MSRLNSIRSAVAAHVTTAFTNAGQTVTLLADPTSFDTVPKDQYPVAVILFVEESPERLDFKQQIRRVNGEVAIAMIQTTRETMDARIEAIRDLIFADATLSSSVDGVTAEAGTTTSGPDDIVVYGTLDVSTEEVY